MAENAGRRTCYATGCGAEALRGLPMCLPHWSMVPAETRGVIRELWARDKARGEGPSAEYREVVRLARLLVAKKEAAGTEQPAKD